MVFHSLVPGITEDHCPVCGELIKPSRVCSDEFGVEQVRLPFECDSCRVVGEVIYDMAGIEGKDGDWIKADRFQCPHCENADKETITAAEGIEDKDFEEVTRCFICEACDEETFVSFDFGGVWIDDDTVPETTE